MTGTVSTVQPRATRASRLGAAAMTIPARFFPGKLAPSVGPPLAEPLASTQFHTVTPSTFPALLPGVSSVRSQEKFES